MFDTIISSVSCLFGTTSACEMQNMGGATPPLQSLVYTIAVGSAVLIAAVWNDAIKTFLKGSMSGLVSATILMFAGILVPSVPLAALSAGVLVLALIFGRTLKSHKLNLRNRAAIPLRKLVLPASAAVYVAGALAITAHGIWRPPPPGPTKKVAFFAPSRLVHTTLDDIALSDQPELLGDIDLGPKTVMSGTFADLDVEFHPSYPREQHMTFRDRFGQKTAARLDFWLSQEPDLKHLSEKVDIALEENAQIQSSSRKPKLLVVRAYLSKRDPESNLFRRITAGDSIVAHGTYSTRDEVLLILTVRLATKLLGELDLPPLTPQVQARIWQDFSLQLGNRISDILDFNGSNLPNAIRFDGQDARDAAQTCTTSECALRIAGVLERMIQMPDSEESLLPTASVSYEAAYGQ